MIVICVTVDKENWLPQVPFKGKGKMSLNQIYEKELLARSMRFSTDKREEQVLKKCE